MENSNTNTNSQPNPNSVQAQDKAVQIYLQNRFKEYKKSLPLPASVSSLKHLFESQISKELRSSLYKEFPLLRRWSNTDIHTLLTHQILNRIIILNFYKLKKFIGKTIQQFLSKLDLRGDLDIEMLLSLLRDNIDHNNSILFDAVPKVNNTSKIDKKTSFEVINTKVQEAYTAIVVYQQLIYSKFELSDFYTGSREEINQEVRDAIRLHCLDKYSGILKDVEKSLKKHCANCMKEFETNFQQNLDEVYSKRSLINVYVDAYKQSKKYIEAIFKDFVVNELRVLPCDIFFSFYLKEIDDKIFSSIIKAHLYTDSNENITNYKEPMFDKISLAFEGCGALKNEGNMHLFEVEKFRNPDNISILFNIVILTEYIDPSDPNSDVYFKELEAFYKVFIQKLVPDFPQLEKNYQLVNNKENFIKNKSLAKSLLEAERKKWTLAVDSFENLYSMACLFFAFHQTTVDEVQRKYDSNKRFMLRCIFRSLKNGQTQFSNFQILCMMESLSLTTPFQMNASTNQPGDNAKSFAGEENSFIESENYLFREYAGCLEDLDIDVKKPEKFILEQVSDPKVASKSIVICIGDYCMGDKNIKDWQSVADRYPSSEVFTLKWDSNATKNIFTLFLKEFTELNNANKGLILGFVFPQISPLLIGYATYHAVKELKNDVWDRTYEEACSSGIYLAHVLSTLYEAKDYVVNLIGFGQGTLVALSCIWELERLNKQGFLYDVMLLGGVANLADFYKSPMSSIGHQLINCYCKRDSVLKYWLKTVSYNLKPIGAEPIFCPNSKIKNIDITEDVKGHMDYKENMSKILFKSDFNNDLNYLLL